VHAASVAEDDPCRDQGRVQQEIYVREVDVEGVLIPPARHEDQYRRVRVVQLGPLAVCFAEEELQVVDRLLACVRDDHEGRVDNETLEFTAIGIGTGLERARGADAAPSRLSGYQAMCLHVLPLTAAQADTSLMPNSAASCR
jgi:hypothetical protein